MATIINKEVLHQLDIYDRVLSVARSQMGFAEIPKGSNWGKHVQKYLTAVGINFPASWCMAYVYWCVNEACKELKTTNPLIKTGGVLNMWNKVTPTLKSKVPKRGCIFIMDYGGGLGHTGIVENVLPEGKIATIEGNTDSAGGREGFEICRRTRNVANCKGFIYLT